MSVAERLNRRLSGTAGLTDPDSEKRGAQGFISSSLDLVPLQRLFGNMMVLKDGTFRMVMKVGAVNFDLKSDREQMGLISAFGELLNALSVDFTLQVLLHAAMLNTEEYIADYEARLREPGITPQMRWLIEGHIEHFQNSARAMYLLDRSFYVVVPFFGTGQSGRVAGEDLSDDMPLGGMLKGLLDGSNKEKRKEPDRRDMEIARTQLMQRCSLVISQLSRLGVRAEPLSELQLVALLREMYNPDVAEHSKLREIPQEGLISMSTNRTRARLEGPNRPLLGDTGRPERAQLPRRTEVNHA